MSNMENLTSQNFEERLREIFGDEVASLKEKSHRHKEYLKKIASKHKGGFRHAMF